MSPIQIDGNGPFRAQVVANLNEICPCRTVRLTPQGVVEFAGAGSCSCSRAVGCDLVGRLVEGAHPFTIRLPSGEPCSSVYDPTNKLLFFCPGERLESCFGQPSAPPSVTLAHEMVHALMDLYYNTSSCPGDPGCHRIVVPAENQIRQEMGLPPRCCYGTNRMPMFHGFLPDEWVPGRTDCPPELDMGPALDRFLWTVKWGAVSLLMDAIRAKRCPEPKRSGETVESLDQQVRIGLDYRTAQDWHDAVEAQWERLSALEGELFELDMIVVGSGVGVILIHRGEAATTLVTNRTVEGSRLVALPGVIVATYPPAPPDSLWRGLPNFPPGFGGRPALVDGSVTRVRTREASTSYYGLKNRLGDAGPDRPEDKDDALRWDAGNAVLDAFLDLADQVPTSVRPI